MLKSITYRSNPSERLSGLMSPELVPRVGIAPLSYFRAHVMITPGGVTYMLCFRPKLPLYGQRRLHYYSRQGRGLPHVKKYRMSQSYTNS